MVFALYNHDTKHLNDNKNSRQEIGASIINMAFASVAMAA
jgi:hypothetical protein